MDESERTDPAHAGDDLDFERADFGEEGAASSLVCSACGGTVGDTYFQCDEQFVCARCEAPVREAWPPSSGPARFFGAAVAGSIAAAVASALWLGVTELTGYEIGLIAIVVGWIVGFAVQLGNRGVGGVPYQLIAVFLTYTAIVATYVPMLVSGIEAEWSAQAPAEAQLGQDASGLVVGIEDEGEVTSSEGGLAANDEAAGDLPDMSPEEARWVAILVSVPLAYAVPFLSGFENVIGILIIGFALHQAWRMTGKHEPVWSGPFRVGSEGAE